MFPGARGKLEDAGIILQQLELARDVPSFRSLFNAFLSAARAITYALQKDGDKVSGFAEWYAEKQAEMRGDELLRFMHEARIEDFHQGRQRLRFSTRVHRLSTEEVEPGPAAGAALVIGSEGPFWLVDGGTARERRVPVKGTDFVTRVVIANAPRTHMGRSLRRTDPLSVCRVALTYFEELVHEARSKFGRG